MKMALKTKDGFLICPYCFGDKFETLIEGSQIITCTTCKKESYRNALPLTRKDS